MSCLLVWPLYWTNWSGTDTLREDLIPIAGSPAIAEKVSLGRRKELRRDSGIRQKLGHYIIMSE